MRNGLLAGLSLAMLLLFFAGTGSGLAAQGAVARAEPATVAVLDKPPSSVRLWLEEPPSAPGAEVQVEPSNGRNDDLVTIALATFGAAAAAVVVGLAAYLVRVRLGLVKAPPPPDEEHSTQ